MRRGGLCGWLDRMHENYGLENVKSHEKATLLRITYYNIFFGKMWGGKHQVKHERFILKRQKLAALHAAQNTDR